MTTHNRSLPPHLAYCQDHDKVYDVSVSTDHIVKSKCPECDKESVLDELLGGVDTLFQNFETEIK